MSDFTARFFEPLLRLLLPAQGRHRSPEANPAPYAPYATAPRAAVPPLRGEEIPRVRPYFLAHERRSEEARRQRARRRTLWLAMHGVDLGPRIIHGIEVAA